MDELTRLETAIHRGPEHGIFTICVALQPIDVTNMFGARVAFESSETEADELALTIGRDAPIVLKPVEARASRSDVMRIRRNGLRPRRSPQTMLRARAPTPTKRT